MYKRVIRHVLRVYKLKIFKIKHTNEIAEERKPNSITVGLLNTIKVFLRLFHLLHVNYETNLQSSIIPYYQMDENPYIH